MDGCSTHSGFGFSRDCVSAVLSQIQFPALDIRLSYNDIQLFLAIAKSIPTASTPLPPEGTAAPGPPSSARDSFQQKTQALIGASALVLVLRTEAHHEKEQLSDQASLWWCLHRGPADSPPGPGLQEGGLQSRLASL